MPYRFQVIGELCNRCRDTASRRPSRALPITVTLALAGAWFGVLQVMGYWSVRGAGSQRSYYDAALRLARAELQLRAQGVRRCAARLLRRPLFRAPQADPPAECSGCWQLDSCLGGCPAARTLAAQPIYHTVGKLSAVR